MDETLDRAKKIWSFWDVRVLVLLSLLIQVALTFLAPLRKRSASSPLKLLLLLLYLSATAVALYIISQISGNPDKAPENVDLLAFWAPFLLLHLGGPDTITALALEDNELWHRHALEVITQVGITLYVFVNFVLRPFSPMLAPNLLMFIDGGIKYMERTQALYYASIDSFRDSLETDPEPGPNYSRLMDVYSSSKTANIPTVIQGKDDPSSDVAVNADKQFKGGHNTNETKDNEEGRGDATSNVVNYDFCRKDTDKMVVEAHEFYNKFKVLFADHFLSLKDRKECRDKFVKMGGAEAVRIIEIELNLIYDVFYTKVFLVDSKQAYFRVLSYISVIVSLLWFSLLNKRKYDEVDVLITYILLAGAVALDISALVMLVVSDWYLIINERRKREGLWTKRISTTLLYLLRWLRSPDCDRWSRSISRYNLLQRCFKDAPSICENAGIRRIKDGLIGFLYVKDSDKSTEAIIVKFVADELKKKAQLVMEDDDLKVIKEVCSARGNLILEEDYCLLSDYLQPWTIDVDYDESLLIWHIATDICYHTCTFKEDNGEDSSAKKLINDYKQISKNLSEYMAYLLLRQQTLVSSVVGMSDKRFADTRAEARKFETSKRLESFGTDYCRKAINFVYKMTIFLKGKIDDSAQEREDQFLKSFCKRLLDVNMDVRPIVAKGDKSKSVLFEACRLAKQLKMLGPESQWKIISKVWLELMCYAAVRCSPRSHIAQLNKGGELITIVWLLMAHLGFGDRFLQNQGFGWTKLIIQK